VTKKAKAPAAGFEALRPLRDKLAKEAASSPGAKGPKPQPRPLPPPAPKDDAGRRDADVLQRAYAGVEPLDRTRGRGAAHLPAGPAPEREAAPVGSERSDAARDRLRDLALGASRFEVTDEGDRVEGRRIDVPNDALRKLRRGVLPIDARLDLHGQSSTDAHASLHAFLRAAHDSHERCVLVIHGKGLHAPQGMGVLRGEIAAWLSQGRASEHVAAFATALRQDGGEGAVYVMLRR
jgi:DNA-nicking Smr family endonuclease